MCPAFLLPLYSPMTDILSKKKRSQVMAAVRSTGNKNTELRLITILRAHQITGWRRRQKLPGKPDFLFRAQRVAVFVDGCFWHGCSRHCRMPKSNVAFWRRKIGTNRKRDLIVNRCLRKNGWRVIRFWEHSLAKPEAVAKRLQSSLARISGSR